MYLYLNLLFHCCQKISNKNVCMCIVAISICLYVSIPNPTHLHHLSILDITWPLEFSLHFSIKHRDEAPLLHHNQAKHNYIATQPWFILRSNRWNVYKLNEPTWLCSFYDSSGRWFWTLHNVAYCEEDEESPKSSGASKRCCSSKWFVSGAASDIFADLWDGINMYLNGYI